MATSIEALKVIAEDLYKTETIKATVKKQVQYPTMKAPMEIKEKITFILYIPKESISHIAKRCYMGVIFDNGYDGVVDVSDAGTLDIKKLAAEFIETNCGKQVRGYKFS